MALSGIDNVDCSGLAALLQSTNISELEGTIRSIEKHYPNLAQRIVLALGGYGSEVSPLGLGNRTEWDELLRLGYCFAASFSQAGVVAANSGIELVTVATQPVLLHQVTVMSGGSNEVQMTDSGGGAFVDTTIVPKPLRASNPAVGLGVSTVKVFAGSNATVLGSVWARSTHSPGLVLQGTSFIFEQGLSVGNIAAWGAVQNDSLIASFQWAEPPATWPT